MTEPRGAPRVDPALLGQQVLAILDEGARTGTHKLHALLGLLDALSEATPGVDPTGVTDVAVRDIATAVVRIVWRQTLPIDGGRSEGGRLLQMKDARPNKLVSPVQDLRSAADLEGITNLDIVSARLAGDHASAVDSVARTLARYPLPLLQRGAAARPFLFDPWPEQTSWSTLIREQGREEPAVSLLPGVAPALLGLTPLLRPTIEAQLVADVARWNGLETTEERLRRHLFGAFRDAWPEGLLEGLLDLQRGRCFFHPSEARLRTGEIAIDHVLPWSRTRLDALPNLVVARASTNSSKGDLLPARPVIDRWVGGFDARARLATELGLPPLLERTRTVGRTTYATLPVGTPLWAGRDPAGRQVEALTEHDRRSILRALGPGTDRLAADASTRYQNDR